MSHRDDIEITDIVKPVSYTHLDVYKRQGIRSFDQKRYYYYAHLRQNFPYVKTLKEGSIVQAGDVIGYMGHTGYSTTENVNNIDTTHLHFGLQLIFDESQKEGASEIWVDCYSLVPVSYTHLDVYKRQVSDTFSPPYPWPVRSRPPAE